MQIKLLLIIGLYFLSTNSAQLYGQIIDNSFGNAFSEEPFFNTPFISQNKIKRIYGKIASKNEGEPIEQLYQQHIYDFNRNGKLRFISSVNNNTQDTSITYFDYSGDTVVCRTKSDAGGFYRYCFDFNASGHISSSTYSRIKNENAGKFSFREGRAIDVATETYEYSRYDNQLQSTIYNSSSRPYKKEIRYYNEYNYLTEYYTQFVMTNKRTREVYTYNEKGLISKKAVWDDINDESKTTYDYKYDAIGNLLEVNAYKGEDAHYFVKQFMYDKETMLLEAQLTKYIETNRIGIITYTYDFYTY